MNEHDVQKIVSEFSVFSSTDETVTVDGVNCDYHQGLVIVLEKLAESIQQLRHEIADMKGEA